jgi:hypothetical protein
MNVSVVQVALLVSTRHFASLCSLDGRSFRPILSATSSLGSYVHLKRIREGGTICWSGLSTGAYSGCRVVILILSARRWPMLLV